VIRDVCRITHQSDEAYIGALAVVLAIRFIASGIWSHKNSLLIAVVESLPDSAVRDRLKEFLPLTVPPSKIASQYGASGWVVDTVPLALYCAQFIAERPLSVTLAQAIEVGGDTDTIASITGRLQGPPLVFRPITRNISLASAEATTLSELQKVSRISSAPGQLLP
jgi:ADP-ribosylglycohydrolase